MHDDGPVVFPDAGITFLNPLVSADIKPCIDVLFRGIMKVIILDDEVIDCGEFREVVIPMSQDEFQVRRLGVELGPSFFRYSATSC